MPPCRRLDLTAPRFNAWLWTLVAVLGVLWVEPALAQFGPDQNQFGPGQASDSTPAPDASGPAVEEPIPVMREFTSVQENDTSAQDRLAQHTEEPPKRRLNRWSVGLTAGTYTPSLKSLNRALNTPGLVILQDPNFLIPRNENLPVEIRDVGVPSLSSDINYGIEAQWEFRPRVSVVIMALNWQGNSQITDTINMSLRSNLPPVDVPRTADYNLNLNQLWLGWRYALFDRPKLGRVFVSMGVVGITVADLTMDSLVKVQLPENSSIPSFASISSTEFHGTAFSTRYGLGGEIHITKHVAVGFQANYIFSEVRDFTVERYFPSGFTELPPIPSASTAGLPSNVLPTNFQLPQVGDQLSTAQVDIARETTELVGDSQDLTLNLNGWETSFTIRFYY